MTTILITAVILVYCANTSASLLCYTCENEENNLRCTQDVKECEEGMDTCQTVVAFSGTSQKLSITKTCTKNESCEHQINATRDDDMPCDKSLYTWVCTSCCYEDMCNVSSGPRTLPMYHEWLLFCCFIALYLSHHYICPLDLIHQVEHRNRHIVMKQINSNIYADILDISIGDDALHIALPNSDKPP